MVLLDVVMGSVGFATDAAVRAVVLDDEFFRTCIVLEVVHWIKMVEGGTMSSSSWTRAR